MDNLDISQVQISLDNFVEDATDASKEAIVSKLKNGGKEIVANNITKVIDLGNGSKFCIISGISMFEYKFDGFMDAGNSDGSGGGLAGGFVSAFRNPKDGNADKICEALKNANGGKSAVDYGECKVVKADWMKNHLKDKDILYAVGVPNSKNNRIVKLQELDKLFSLTIEF